MILTLIRHSKTSINPYVHATQWGLSNDGILKAHELSNKPEIKEINVLYSSLQTKAIETTLYLAKPNFIPIKTDNRLTEVTSITNKFMPEEEFKKATHDFHTGQIDRINDGETITEALNRFNKAVDDIVTSETVNNIGIVSHGNILSLFSAQYYDMKSIEIHNKMQMPDVAVFDWGNKKFIKFFS